MRPRLDLYDERVLDLLSAWGTPYSFGAGRPSDGVSSWPPADPPAGIGGGLGWDCSGFAQAALVRLGFLSPSAGDRSAAALFLDGVSVPVEDARLGDLAFYGSGGISHVMVCLGRGVVIGASGGTSKTNGSTPSAFVDIKPRIAYRSDFRGVRRFLP